MNCIEPSKGVHYWDQLCVPRAQGLTTGLRGISAPLLKRRSRRGGVGLLFVARILKGQHPKPTLEQLSTPMPWQYRKREGTVQPGVNCQISDKLLGAGMEKFQSQAEVQMACAILSVYSWRMLLDWWAALLHPCARMLK